jgi:hypothetical protein
VRPGDWLLQGIRYGLAIACVAPIPMYLIYYAVQPMPPNVVGKQIIGDTILYIINGIAMAFINKPAAVTES